MVVLLPACGWAGTYSGGTGLLGNPFQIATPEDMDEIGRTPGDWCGLFLLTADINLAGYTGTQFHIIGEYPNKPFTGVFDGSGHIISNFTYSTPNIQTNIGIFGFINGATAEIKNLTLINPNVNVNAEYSRRVGALVGRMDNGTISDCAVEQGSVSSHEEVGALVGHNNGIISDCYTTVSVSGGSGLHGGLVGISGGVISNCYATGNVSGFSDVGGLVGGTVFGATIENCYATGNISALAEAGGLVGCNCATISNCYATGNVVVQLYDAGGLIGNSEGVISTCYAIGEVSGNQLTGGLIGTNVASQGPANIVNCYATGSVTANDYVGGLVAWNREGGTISNCYATGPVAGNDYTGGLVGYNEGATITACFWDINTTGQQTSSGGGVGKTTAEMYTSSTYTDAGWDFAPDGSNKIWMNVDGASYPWLTWTDCLNPNSSEYADWVAWGRQGCWCYARQCRGDINGKKTGPFRVQLLDLQILAAAFNKNDNKLAQVPGGICADVNHKKTGPSRVKLLDLQELSKYFNKPEAQVPMCDQTPLLTGPYNYFVEP